MWNPFIVLLCAAVGCTLYGSVKPSPEMSYEASITSMKRKIITLESKLNSLESKETVQKVKNELAARMEDMRTELNERMNEMYTESKTRNQELNERMNEMNETYTESKTRSQELNERMNEMYTESKIRNQELNERMSEMNEMYTESKTRYQELNERMNEMYTESKTRNQELNERMNEMYTESKTRQDNITAKLEELFQRTLEQKEVTDGKHSGMEIKVEEVSKRLQKETDRFLIMNNHLLHELLQVQKKWDEVSEKIQTMEDEVKSSLEMGRSKTEKLELKGNLTRGLLVNYITSQPDVHEAIRQNATTSVELLRQHVNESVLGLENGQSVIKTKMSNLASLITKLEKVCGNVSKLDESLQSFRKEVKQSEDLRSAEASDMQKTLKNHTSEIGTMNAQLFDIQNSCSDPPPIRNGYPVVGDGRLLGRKHGTLATYVCEDGSTLARSGDLVCRLGEWTGVLPRCAKNCIAQDLKNEYDGLDIPTNTTVEHSKTVDVRCRRGYVVFYPSASPTCNDGTWHVTADPCIKALCADDPPSLRNGKATNFERLHGSRVLYDCDKNFVMTGNSTVRCEFGKWDGHPPDCSYFDATFYAEIYRDNPTYDIECHSDSYAGNIQFSRVVDTGTGGGLPMGARLSTSDKSAKMDLSGTRFPDFHGIYRCGFEAEEGSTYAVVPYQYGILHFPDPSPMTSVGNNVTLRLVSRIPVRRVLWSKDGKSIPNLEGRAEFHVAYANSRHQGIYSARFEGETYDRAFVRFSVRRCKANVFGERCDQVCPPCYNGGTCHDLLGICVCPEGFVGRNCETPCPEGFHGADCSTACGDGKCKFRFFCKPDPYGCPCAPGFKGVTCDDECDQGWYGASCKQPCRCAEGSDCNRFTGACSAGCAPGWKGLSCQIRDNA